MPPFDYRQTLEPSTDKHRSIMTHGHARTKPGLEARRARIRFNASRGDWPCRTLDGVCRPSARIEIRIQRLAGFFQCAGPMRRAGAPLRRALHKLTTEDDGASQRRGEALSHSLSRLQTVLPILAPYL